MLSFDICIPFHPKDICILNYCVSSIRCYLPEVKNIYVISETQPDIEDVCWIPESVYPFTKEDIGKYILCKGRIGWYYQQLLKLYCYRALPSTSEHILIVDSDVVLKEHIDFFCPIEKKILFAVSKENTLPYFEHMKKVIPGLTKQYSEHSGITHHIMTKREHMEELLSKIESIHKQEAWKAMVSLVDPEFYPASGMSEYEIYFNYCLQYHPNSYKIRILPFKDCIIFKDFIDAKTPYVAIHTRIDQ